MTTRMLPVIPGYRLEHEIGRGGAGVVYAGERLVDGLPVAIKVLDGRYSQLTSRARVAEEARASNSADHPGVVRVLDVGEQDGTRWLVLERVHGPSLQAVLDEAGALPPQVAVEVLAQAAEAVAALHDGPGMVHGDLKPANILFEAEPAVGGDTAHGTEPLPGVKVSDFGLARRLASDSAAGLGDTTEWLFSDVTRPEAADGAGGTAPYMPPEQWSGKQLTAAADVYALGATLYAALTGQRPFPQRSLTELAYAVATEPPPAPSTTRPDLPTGFDAVVAQAMAKEAGLRYRTAGDFARAVRDAVAGDVAAHTPALATAGRAGGRNGAGRGVSLLGRFLSPACLLLALLCFALPFLTVSCEGLQGRPDPGATAEYSGVDLVTGSPPQVEHTLSAKQRDTLTLPPQPLFAAAAGLVILSAAGSLVRRRRHEVVAALAVGAGLALVAGEAVARARLAARIASLLAGQMPEGHTIDEMILVGRAYWTSLVLTASVAAGHGMVLTHRWWRRRVDHADRAPPGPQRGGVRGDSARAEGTTRP